MNNYSKHLIDNNILVYAIDGLDGAGKGTAAAKIMNMLKDQESIIHVDLPFYTSKWGKILKYLLHENDMGLTQDERMAVYAMNRIELIDSIKSEVLRLIEKNKNDRVIILFNRFPFSSLITSAYYLAKTKYKDLSSEEVLEKINKNEVDVDVQKDLEFILDLEHYFFESFGNNIKIYIPAIDPKVSIDRVKHDSKRIKADLYEDLKVQFLGNYIYHQAEKYYSNLKSFPQVGRAPEEIAKEALKSFGYKKRKATKGEKLEIFDIKEHLHSRISKDSRAAVAELFEKYPNIKKLESLKL